MVSASQRRSMFRLQAIVLKLATAVVDAGPDFIRYGIGRSIRNKLLSTSLPSLSFDGMASSRGATVTVGASAPDSRVVVLTTRSLETGGVEAVVAALARELPNHGFEVVVLCQRGGRTADLMLSAGIRVVEARDRDAAEEFTSTIPENSIVQLHNAPEFLTEALRERGYPIVSVIHSIDVNLDSDAWHREARLADSASVTIAVSDRVRSFYLSNMPPQVTCSVVVVPNGVDLPLSGLSEVEAKSRLSGVINCDLQGSIVLSCLARYDLQKNIPGLVASFLRAAESRADVHLVIAGPVEDWLEHALANALRLAHPAAKRVHLLGAGSATALLAASDGFVLNSFFEGWPIAATEAATLGVPLIMSDVGGAVELIGRERKRGFLVDNPATNIDEVNLHKIRRARRHISNQSNSKQLRDAISSFCQEIEYWRSQRVELATEARTWLGSDVMGEAHARVLWEWAGSARTSR